MLEILQSRLQQYMNRKLPDVQAGIRKGRGTRDQIANIHWIIIQKKKSASVSLTLLKPLTVWITANLENSAVATGLEKISFHSNPKERQCQECSNYHTIALISHTREVML